MGNNHIVYGIGLFLLSIHFLSVATVSFAAEPSIVIRSPANNGSYAYETMLTFLADATDPEDMMLTGNSIIWMSDQDGFLGYGTSFTKRNLSTGEHLITATATDSAGDEAIASITVTISNSPPTVIITSPADNSTSAYGSIFAFLANATDSEDSVLTGQSVIWESDRDGFLGFGTSFTNDDLSIGSHTITVTATDSVGATDTDQITVTIQNDAPKVLITSPANNSEIGEGQIVAFLANATDPEDNVLTGQSVVWQSDRDGFLGFGASFTKSNLSVGTHVITVTATDSTGIETNASITITVGNALPEVVITAPADNSNIPYGTVTVFLVTVTDHEDTILTGQSIAWQSDRDGFLGYGTSLTNSTLSVGTHIITVTATDSADQQSNASITITVGNASPTILIRLPVENSSYNYGTNISFLARITDREDGDLSGESIVWISDRDGFFAYGSSFSTGELSVGTHVITITATDSGGAVTSTTLTLTVKDGSPEEIEIIAPLDGDTFFLNDYIDFQGSATDSEDGDLSGDNLVWTSNLESGVIGTGEVLRVNTLSAGKHLITLTATDSANNIAIKDFIIITVQNSPPVPTITTPYAGTTVRDIDIVDFTGYATDAEDGELQGTALTWESSLDGFLGSGKGTLTRLSPGEHVISLIAKDSYGKEGKATINLTVSGTEESIPMTLDTPYGTLALGEVETFFISGGHPPYRYVKDYPDITDIAIDGSVIRVVAKAMGETTFQIMDHENTTRTLHVTITDRVDNLPFADAGPDLTVREGNTVLLDGTASISGSYGIASWQWEQLDEDKSLRVVLLDETAPQTTFIAPSVDTSLMLDFRLTVIDANGSVSFDDLTIRVLSNEIDEYPDGVVSFLTADSADSLGLALTGDGAFVEISPKYPQFISESAGRPENMIYGLVDLKIKVNEGGQADMVLYFPSSVEAEYSIYKYRPSMGWYDYSKYVTYSADRTRAYVILRDGDVGDDDGKVNGIISDPITVGTAPTSPPPSYPDDSDEVIDDSQSGEDSGGGCFISTLF